MNTYNTLPPSVEPSGTAYYRALLDSLMEAIYTVDIDGVITYWNRGCEQLLGWPAPDMVGRPYPHSPVALSCDPDGTNLSARLNMIHVLSNPIPMKWKGTMLRNDDRPIMVKSQISPIFLNDNRIAGAVEVFRDMTQQVALQEAHQLTLEQSRRDPLTSLYNRGAMLSCLKAEIDRSRRYKQPLSVILCDIDNFKQINDRYGHDTGDVVLRAVGKLFLERVRQPDVPGRWGGEEFLIVVPNGPQSAAASLAERLRSTLEHIRLPEYPHPFTASFGVGEWYPDQSLDQLLYITDCALYLAKSQGRNCVRLGQAHNEFCSDD